MYRYRSFGLIIHSELDLGDLPHSLNQSLLDHTPDVSIRFGEVPRPRQKATLWEDRAFNRQAGTFQIKNGNEIIIDPVPGADADLLRVLVNGRIMAFLMRQRGWLPLHASGVLIDGRAVLFLGESGSGKSTTSAAFHVQGCPVITDDVSAVRIVGGRCVVCPGSSGLRLLSDARAVVTGIEGENRVRFQWDKFSYNLEAETLLSDPIPVHQIYLLEYGDQIQSVSVSELQAVALLSTHSFTRRRRLESGTLKDHIDICCAVASSVPLFRISRKRSLTDLPELVAWIRAGIAKRE